MKIKSIVWAFAALCAVFAVSCADLSEFEERLDSFESRIQALEIQIANLNGNVEALQTLAGGGTINSVEEKEGVYTITCSNGSTLTINQGSIGVGNAPVLSIDKDGYWMADYGDGPVHVLAGENKVRALGIDGITPIFGVSAEGYWTVKFGSDASQLVNGADGNPVSALPSGSEVEDAFFDDVKYDEAAQKFTITLKNGDVYTVPVVSSFLCAIQGADGIQVFQQGGRKAYSVEMRGVSKTFITAPDGWNASLTSPSSDNIATLTVIAPLLTKSESSPAADTRTDFSILALSSQGYATVAKMTVQLEGMSIDFAPLATLGFVKNTIESLEYSVVLADATGYKYIIQEASVEAPTADKVAAEGVPGPAQGNLTLTGLAEDTQYTLYVLPMNGDVKGELVTMTQYTKQAPISDWYDAYQNKGKTIVINGVRYSKAINGDATLIEAKQSADGTFATTIKNSPSGVYFVDTPEGTDFSFTGYNAVNTGYTKVMVGRYADKPAVVKLSSGCVQLQGGSLVVKNVIFDGSAQTNGYMVTLSGGVSSVNLHFDGCQFNDLPKPVIYAHDNNVECGVESISFTNNKFRRPASLAAATNNNVCSLGNTKAMRLYKEMRFDNNVVYSENPGVTQVFTYNAKEQSTGEWDNVISISDNIFYNVPSHGNTYLRYYLASKLDYKNNVFVCPTTYDSNWILSYCYGEGQNPEAVDFSGNIAYGLTESRSFVISHASGKFKPAVNSLVKLSETPFTSFDTKNGSYVLKSAYEGCGPQN